nr:MAG TPA: hypothetical protein [Caudoviricetes sp.]
MKRLSMQPGSSMAALSRKYCGRTGKRQSTRYSKWEIPNRAVSRPDAGTAP